MAPAIEVRPGSASDSRDCFAIFRRSLGDLLQRTGYARADAAPRDLDSQWPSYTSLFEHLAATCAEWWIALDSEGVPAGYARTTDREGHLELTECFVRPEARVAGVGRALLERAFPVEAGVHRPIIATTDAPAVALHLRFGAAEQSTGVGLAGVPRAVSMPDGYHAEPANAATVLELE